MDSPQEEATIQQVSGELGQESIGGIKRMHQKPKDCQGVHMLMQRIKQQLKQWSTEANVTKGITFNCNLDNASSPSSQPNL